MGEVVDRGVQVTEPGEAVRHGRDGAVTGLDVLDLVPGDRRRHGRLGIAPHRVGSGDRVVASILVVIDEDRRRVAVLAPPRRRHVLRCPALDLPGEGERCPSYLTELPPRLDPHVHVQAGPARGLREADDPQLVEHLVAHPRHPPHPVEGSIRHRVEVDPPLVGTVDVGGADIPRVQLDGAHLHRPDDLRELGRAELVGVEVVAGEVEAHRAHPVGGSLRQALLVHLGAGDALREAVEHRRSLPERAQDAVADGQVVVREVELRLAPGGEVDPVGGGDAHVAAADVQVDVLAVLAAGHDLSVRARG